MLPSQMWALLLLYGIPDDDERLIASAEILVNEINHELPSNQHFLRRSAKGRIFRGSKTFDYYSLTREIIKRLDAEVQHAT